MGVREVMGSCPDRGNNKKSFSSCQETGKVSLLKCLSIPNSKFGSRPRGEVQVTDKFLLLLLLLQG